MQRMPRRVADMLDDIVKVVQLIKTGPLDARLFSVICKGIRRHQTVLLLHTAVKLVEIW